MPCFAHHASTHLDTSSSPLFKSSPRLPFRLIAALFAVVAASRTAYCQAPGIPHHGSDAPLAMGHHLDEGPQPEIDILSDTHGVDFNPYLHRLVQQLEQTWHDQGPSHPLSTSAYALIRMTVLPDGSISAIHLDGSSQDDDFTHQAWTSVRMLGKLAPLPLLFRGPDLTLRLHFSAANSIAP